MIRVCGRLLLVLSVICTGAYAQTEASLKDLTEPHDYVQKRVSSYDRSGGNEDFRTIELGKR